VINKIRSGVAIVEVSAEVSPRIIFNRPCRLYT